MPGPKTRPRVDCETCGRPRPDPGVCTVCAKRAKRRAAGVPERKQGFCQKTYMAGYHYGLSPEQFSQLEAEAGGRCQLCGEEPETARGLHIDHCHETGRVRGLLCTHCNRGLGGFRDRPDLLAKAIEYLKP